MFRFFVVIVALGLIAPTDSFAACSSGYYQGSSFTGPTVSGSSSQYRANNGSTSSSYTSNADGDLSNGEWKIKWTSGSVTGTAYGEGSCNSTSDKLISVTSFDMSKNDSGSNCWCRMTKWNGTNLVSNWVEVYRNLSSCTYYCARYCTSYINSDSGIRSNMFNSVYECTICPASAYCADGIFSYTCPSGYDYNTNTGKTTLSQCQKNCGSGKYFAAGTTSQTSYTELEYIENTSGGGQYINTGYTVQSNNISGTISIMPSDASSQGDFINGTNFSVSCWATNCALWANSNRALNYFLPKSSVSIYNMAFEINSSGKSFTINNITLSDSYVVSSITGYNIKLFTTGSYYFVGRIYGMKFYDNGSLVLDLVPAKRNSDNAVGMYNRVSNTFLPNAGSGSFVAGPIVGSCQDIGTGYWSANTVVNYGTYGTRSTCTGLPTSAYWTGSGTSASNCPWACPANYYKNSSVCSACPNSGLSAAGSTAATQCYLPANTNYSDSKGTYHFSSNCYYSN